MTEAAINYVQFFQEEDRGSICIKLSNNTFFDATGVVRFIKGDRLTLELVGTDPTEDVMAETGTDVFITFWTSWSLCRCSAVLIQKVCGRQVFLQLTGPVIEKQTREYFRLDVTIPICYTIYEKQLLQAVHEEWAAVRGQMNKLSTPVLEACSDGFKVIKWNGQSEIAPRQVNLSGGGLRFKISEYVNPESLVAVNLFLPLFPPRVIHAVAESLRCSEIVLGREKISNYINAMRFHFINEKDRETIIAYISVEQRRILSTRIARNTSES